MRCTKHVRVREPTGQELVDGVVTKMQAVGLVRWQHMESRHLELGTGARSIRVQHFNMDMG